MIDNGISNSSSFLNYIRKHLDRLAIRAGKREFSFGKLIFLLL